MGRMDYLAMKTDPVAEDLISSDMTELKLAAKKLINDATKLGGLGFGTSFLKWVASFAAILAGDARIIDSSPGCGSKLLCTHLEGQLGRCFDMPPHRLLLAARAHPGLGWIQEFLLSEPWNIKHRWHYPSVSLPCLVPGASLRLGAPCSAELLLLCRT
ncbi:hypothetical protein SCA6_012909 [Theobroma cacao]